MSDSKKPVWIEPLPNSQAHYKQIYDRMYDANRRLAEAFQIPGHLLREPSASLRQASMHKFMLLRAYAEMLSRRCSPIVQGDTVRLKDGAGAATVVDVTDDIVTVGFYTEMTYREISHPMDMWTKDLDGDADLGG